MKTKENSTVFHIAITAGFASLTLFLGITHLGLIPLSPIVSLTIMHTPVILAAIIGGLWSGIGVGFVFGIYSLIQAAIHPSGMLDPLFVNPLVSVLPRMLIGVAAWGIHRLLKMIPKMPRVLSSSIAAFFGSLTNTIFVIGAIYGIKINIFVNTSAIKDDSLRISIENQTNQIADRCIKNAESIYLKASERIIKNG